MQIRANVSARKWDLLADVRANEGIYKARKDKIKPKIHENDGEMSRNEVDRSIYQANINKYRQISAKLTTFFGKSSEMYF